MASVFISKRTVILYRRRLTRRLGRRRRGRTIAESGGDAGSGGTRGCGRAVWGAFPGATRIRKLKRLKGDEGFRSLLPVVLEVFLGQPAFDEDRFPPFEILADRLGLFAPGSNSNKRRIFFLLAGVVLPFSIDGDVEIADGGSLGEIAKFGICREVSGADPFVEVHAHVTTFSRDALIIKRKNVISRFFVNFACVGGNSWVQWEE